MKGMKAEPTNPEDTMSTAAATKPLKLTSGWDENPEDERPKGWLVIYVPAMSPLDGACYLPHQNKLPVAFYLHYGDTVLAKAYLNLCPGRDSAIRIERHCYCATTTEAKTWIEKTINDALEPLNLCL